MSLQSILTEINKIKPLAEEDVDSGPVGTLSARRGRKNQAIEELKRLKSEYRKEMLKTSIFIIAVGSTKDDFTKISTEEFGLFTTDPEEYYSDLAKRVHPTLYLDKQGVSNVFDVLGRHLEDKMNELDILEYNQLLFKSEYSQVLKSEEEFKTLIKRAINKQIGSEVVGIQSVDTLLTKAIDNNYSSTITPIVLPTNDETLATELFQDLKRLTPKVFMVVSGESTKSKETLDNCIILRDNNKKTVEAALNKIKKSIKK